ncbi:MAG: hypothetical protein GC160_14725 [Acidobacteria bacterium]|nr:hypothetical protein [Acidobacteriota bacterium]
MVPRERLLLVVAADWREFGGFAERRPVLAGVRWAFRAELAEGPALLAANGPGRENAERAVAEAVRRFDVSAVVSTGFVGGLAPALELADTFVAERVLRLDPRVEYSGRLPECVGGSTRRGVLVTIDRVAQTAVEKARLHGLGADAVDMEAAAVAQSALELGLPFYCVRVVSDTAETEFAIDFNQARRADGTFSGWRVARQAGLSLSRWRRLLDLKKQSERAAEILADYLRQCRFLPQSNQ